MAVNKLKDLLRGKQLPSPSARVDAVTIPCSKAEASGMINVNVVPSSSPVLQPPRGLEDALQPLLDLTHRFANLSRRNSSQLQPVPGDAKGMGPGTPNSPGSGAFPDDGQHLGWPLSSGGAEEHTGHLEVAFQLGTWTSCTRYSPFHHSPA